MYVCIYFDAHHLADVCSPSHLGICLTRPGIRSPRSLYHEPRVWPCYWKNASRWARRMQSGLVPSQKMGRDIVWSGLMCVYVCLCVCLYVCVCAVLGPKSAPSQSKSIPRHPRQSKPIASRPEPTPSQHQVNPSQPKPTPIQPQVNPKSTPSQPRSIPSQPQVNPSQPQFNHKSFTSQPKSTPSKPQVDTTSSQCTNLNLNNFNILTHIEVIWVFVVFQYLEINELIILFK